MQKNKDLNLFYDTEADVFYFSKGEPSSKDSSSEIGDEVIIRKNPKTKEITGFTILNFSKKNKKATRSLKLPLQIDLKQVSFL